MKLKLGTPETDASHIGVDAADLAGIRKGDSVDKVVGYLVVLVGDDAHAVVVQSHIDTEV